MDQDRADLADPEQDAADAELAFEDGDLPLAAERIGRALAADPTRAVWLAILNRIVARAADPLTLVPTEGGLTPASAAVRAHILATLGRQAEAIPLLIRAAYALPDAPYLDAWAVPWLVQPGVAEGLDLDAIGTAIAPAFDRGPGDPPTPIGPSGFAAFHRILEAIRARNLTNARLLGLDSAILRRLDRPSEALERASEAYDREPSAHAAVALAMAHRRLGDVEAALRRFREAADLAPDRIEPWLDMADLLLERGRAPEALAMYREATRRDPEHPWARPSTSYLRYLLEGDEAGKDELLELADAPGADVRTRDLAARVAPYAGHLPRPTDPTVTLLDQIAGAILQDRSRVPTGRIPVSLKYLEAPSARLAFDLQMAALEHDLRLDYAVDTIQEPDPRTTLGPVQFRTWEFDGTDPRPALPEPDPAVLEAVGRLAGQLFRLGTWWEAAGPIADEIGPGHVRDLLAAMVHPPAFPGRAAAWAWLQHVQVASALILARLGLGPDASAAQALIDLVLGPTDWTTVAAIIALAALAGEDPEAAEVIDQLFLHRLDARPRDGLPCYEHALIWHLRRMPGRSEADRERLDEELARVEARARAGA